MEKKPIGLVKGLVTRKELYDPTPLSLWEAEDLSETSIQGVGMWDVWDGTEEGPEYWLVISDAEEDNGQLVGGQHVSLSPAAALRLCEYIERHREELEQSVKTSRDEGLDAQVPDPARLIKNGHDLSSHYCGEWFAP